MIEKLDIQVMQKDGSLTSYEVQNERDSNVYEVFDKGSVLAVFEAREDGSWQVNDNPGNIDDDLQRRLENQLNGFVR